MAATAIVPAAAAAAFSLFVSAPLAADLPNGSRSTPGTVVPSSGTTATMPAAASSGNAAASAKTPSQRRASRPLDCAALRKRYEESQACFAPYRLANGGIKPEAFKRCRQVADPSDRCGPASVSPGQ